MAAINPEMIKLARESRGYSQNELCTLLGVAQGTISKIENAVMQPSEEVLSKLAQVLDYPVSFFSQPDYLYAPSYIYYRRRISMSKKSLAISEAKRNIIKLGLEKLLNSVDLPETNLFRWDVEDHGPIEQAAQLLRERWKLPRGKVDNISKVVEDNGIIIVLFDFEGEKVDGISLYTEKNHPVIFVNSTLPGDRFRLTIAHEVGHLILHFGKPIAETRDVEKEAFLFASELLVPTAEFRKDFDHLDFRALTNLKLYWKVSMSSLIYKAKQTGLITENQGKYLFAQLSALGYKTKEPLELNIPRETPTLLKEILQLHKEELGYSDEELSRLVHLNATDFKNYYQTDFQRLRIVR
ncbi:helix-turn-helix domain-containing protein [Chitinophaga filiformis]|uniref:XRE family transcriptional regulator n=1 Tax=Chitinophaga filiformis TaxID=104663 RepID=A0ABY4HYD1_CHIFI|nr:XRE family transcriptional regulator [Chitinophaga filiformis]UPK67943.1 XRE family transcriptional regulator [Chitinophaga filiformis]